MAVDITAGSNVELSGITHAIRLEIWAVIDLYINQIVTAACIFRLNFEKNEISHADRMNGVM